MPKHAYLIAAHNEPTILKILISLLDDERNDIYVHVDSKSEETYNAALEIKTRFSNLHIIHNRIDVRWADISLVESEYLLFETAFKGGEYSYFHLLSGVDLPLKNQDAIHAFFDKNQGQEFVHLKDTPQGDKLAYDRMTRYYSSLNIVDSQRIS